MAVMNIAQTVDIQIHETYFIVAHFHDVLFGASVLGVMGAIYFWYPTMFGRKMNETLGKIHFFLTFIFLNGTFGPMHFLGARGFPRRYADPVPVRRIPGHATAESIHHALCIFNGRRSIDLPDQFFGSLIWGKKAGSNPWNANSLEWSAPSPPQHGNFDFQPQENRGPYEYSQPDRVDDYWPQIESPEPLDSNQISPPVG